MDPAAAYRAELARATVDERRELRPPAEVQTAIALVVFFRGGACLCMPLSASADGYSIDQLCPAHGDPVRNATHLQCPMMASSAPPQVPCLVHRENAIRGLPPGRHLEKYDPKPKKPAAKVEKAKEEIASFERTKRAPVIVEAPEGWE